MIRFGYALSCFNAVQGEPERSLHQRFALIRESRCEGFQIDLPLDWPVAEVLEAAAGLPCLVVNDWRQDLARFADHVQIAVALGARHYLHHLPLALQGDPAVAARTTRELRQRCTDAGLEYTIETHRGTYTQDVERTYALLARVPGLRLWGDFSHYLIRGEGWEQLRDLYPHLAGLHLRIAGGNHMQPEIVPGVTEGLDEFAREFVLMRRAGFAGPVVTELIPNYLSQPRYDLQRSNRALLDLARGWVAAG